MTSVHFLRSCPQAGSSADEWQAAVSAGVALGDAGEELVAELNRLPCFLVMEYVHGQPLYKSSDAFKVKCCFKSVLEMLPCMAPCLQVGVGYA